MSQIHHQENNNNNNNNNNRNSKHYASEKTALDRGGGGGGGGYGGAGQQQQMQQHRPFLGVPPSISKQGWFTELETMWPGQKFSLALEGFSIAKSILFHEQSEYQDILVFKSAQYGNVLCLDGVIQLTERDEFAFHEMMVHVPLFAHPNPQTICLVGGGDGGCLRELLRHDTVRRVVLVEIDPVVIEVAKIFFATSTGSTCCWDDDRVEIVHQDAATYLASQSWNVFDVILSDTSDPVGPAESLFQPSFYESMYRALRPQGIVCVQAECFWIHLDLISDLVACCADIFETAEYATTMVPTYPCGQLRRSTTVVSLAAFLNSSFSFLSLRFLHQCGDYMGVWLGDLQLTDIALSLVVFAITLLPIPLIHLVHTHNNNNNKMQNWLYIGL